MTSDNEGAGEHGEVSENHISYTSSVFLLYYILRELKESMEKRERVKAKAKAKEGQREKRKRRMKMRIRNKKLTGKLR
jgi:hypothetical protein